MMTTDMTEHIRHSNLIEGVSGETELMQSLEAFLWLEQQSVLTEATVVTIHNIVMKNLLPPSQTWTLS